MFNFGIKSISKPYKRRVEIKFIDGRYLTALKGYVNGADLLNQWIVL